MKLQKLGGYAAIAGVCAFIIYGIVYIPAFMVPQLLVVSQPLVMIARLTAFAAAVWIGIVLLREKQIQPAAREIEASAVI